VADEALLPELASWELAVRTVDGPRYPAVTFDLDQAPSLAAAVAGLDLGDRIVVPGFRYDPLDLMVIGVLERAQRKRRLVTFACMPGVVFATIGLYDDAGALCDSGSTTLGAGLTTTATAVQFSTAVLGDVWETVDLGYEVDCGGEVWTVTAMGAPTGTGPYLQNATVVRSVNGVVKTHSAGAEIHVHDSNAARWAL
jgi:hypothetical protein